MHFEKTFLGLNFELGIANNRPLWRYGGHFEFSGFKRHYGMLRGQIHINLVIAGIVTPKYGEKLKFTYIKYQLILVV